MELLSPSILKCLAVILAVSLRTSYCSTPPCSSLDSKLIYDYEAEVQVGTEEAVPVASLYKLKGQVIVHRPLSAADGIACHKFQLKDFKYHVFHGDMEKKKNEKEHYESAPLESQDLYIPFNAFYSNLSFESMNLNSNEKDWSLNIKKALVNTFHLPSLTGEDREFTDFETCIFGHCSPSYTVVNSNFGAHVTKVYFTSNNVHPYIHSLDVEESLPRAAENNFQQINGMKKYTVNTRDHSYPVIESIEGTEKIYNSEFELNRDKKFVLTKQNITLIAIKKGIQVTNEILMDGGVIESVKHLKYSQKPSENPFGLLYITNGRGNFQGSHYDLALKKVDDAVDYLQTNHLAGNLKQIVQHQIINELLMHLRYLNTEEIENVYRKVTFATTEKNSTRRNLFFEILPVIGTKASVKFVFKLLKNGEIIDDTKMQNVLAEIPFYVINYDQELIDEAQILLDLEETDKITGDLCSNAILTYSVMYGKYCGSSDQYSSHCTENKQNAIANHFFNKITENNGNYLKQVTYVEGLKNLKGFSAAKHLVNIINNKDIAIKDDLRLRAMMGPNPITKFTSLYSKVYLPILTDTSAPLEMRAAALQMAIDIPFDGILYSLHWHMASEDSARLYNYYYTLLKSYADSVNPQHQSKKVAAKKILQVSRKPSVQTLDTTARIYNYISKLYGYGGELIFRPFGDGKRAIPSMLYAEFNSISGNSPANDLGVHIRVKGLQDIYVQNVLKQLNIPAFKAHVNPQVLENEIQLEPFLFEAVQQRKGYTTQVFVLDGGVEEINYQSLKTAFSRLNPADILFTQTLMYEKLTDHTYMTGIGVPVVLNKHYPVFVSVTGDYSSNESVKKWNTNIRMSGAGGTNLLVFNPVANSWHGISRVHTFDLQLPIGAQFIADKVGKSYEFSLQKSDGDGHIGFQIAAKTYSGIFSGNSAIPSNFVAHGETHPPKSPWEALLIKMSENVFSTITLESEALAYNFHFATSGCNSETPVGNFISSGNEDGSDARHTLINTLTRLSLFNEFLATMPMQGSCSLRAYAYPKANNVGSKFSIKVKINGKETGGSVPLPGYKFNVLTSIDLTGDSTGNSRTVSFDTDVNSSPNGISTSIKTKLSSAVNGVTSGDAFFVDFEKVYPPLGADAFKYGWGDETVKTTLSFKKSSSSIDSNDLPSFSLSAKGEISEEQKTLATSDVYPYNQCEQDKQKPEWQGSLLPRTWPCFEGAIRLFYARKLSVALATKNMNDFASAIEWGLTKSYKSYVHSIGVYPVSSDENENVKKINIDILHSARQPTKDIVLRSSGRLYEFKGVPGIDTDFFSIQVDNTHFSKFVQILEASGFDRSCVVSSETVLLPGNSTVSNQLGPNYAALSKIGDGSKYAVYAKKSGSGLAIKVVIGDGVLEISGSSATVNGKAIDNLDKGYQYPPDNPFYYFRVWSNQGQTTVYSQRLGVYLIYSPVSVTVDQPIILKGFTSGLCGSLA